MLLTINPTKKALNYISITPLPRNKQIINGSQTQKVKEPKHSHIQMAQWKTQNKIHSS